MIAKKKLIVSIMGGFFVALQLWLAMLSLLPQLITLPKMSIIDPVLLIIFSSLVAIISYIIYKRTTRAKHAAGWSAVLLSIGSFILPGLMGLSVYLSFSNFMDAGEALYEGLFTTFVMLFFGVFFGIMFALIAFFELKTKNKADKEVTK